MRRKTSQQPFSRRLFLRGAGTVALGLPFLETFSRFGARAGAQPPTDSFAVWLRQGNGIAQAGNREPERFWPRATGPLTTDGLAAESDRALSELAPYADKILAVAGLRFAFPGNGCGHSGGGNQCLTAARVSDTPSGNESLAMGESVDNRIARELHPEREPLTLFTGRKSGYLPEVMSYRGPLDLRAGENDPFNAYMRMTGLAGMDIELINRIRQRRMSVNDLVRDQMSALLRTDLSADDRSDALRILRELNDELGRHEEAKRLAQQQRQVLDDAVAGLTDLELLAGYAWPREEVYVYLGQGPELVDELTRLTKALPDSYDPPYRLAWLLNKIGKSDEALVYAKDALNKVYGPRKVRAWHLLASVQQERGDVGGEREAWAGMKAEVASLPAGHRMQSSATLADENLARLNGGAAAERKGG